MAKTGRKYFGFYPDEKAVVEIIKLKSRKRKGGSKLGPFAIAKELNAEGHRTQTGRLFRAQTVKDILERGTLFISPKAKKRVKKTSLSIDDYMTAEQIVKCYKVIKSFKHKVIFDLLLGSGLRASELAALQIRDLGVFDGRTEIEVRRGKGAKQRIIIIGSRLAEQLRRYLKMYRKNAGRKEPVFLNSKALGMTYENLYYLIKNIGHRAGVGSLHPHALRHTFATILSNYTENSFFIKDQLGHSSLDTTAIYSKVTTDFKLRKMDLFEELIYSRRSDLFVPENTSKLVNITQDTEFVRV
jgi:integrase